MEFKDALKALRGELGITQIELANALHVNVTTVSRWELGQTLPNRAIAAMLVDYAERRSDAKYRVENLRRTLCDTARRKLKLGEAAASDAEELAIRQLSTIIDNIGGGVTVTVMSDENSRSLAYANEGFYRLFGYTREEYKAEGHGPDTIIHAEDAARVAEAISRLQQTREPVTLIYRAHRKDGELIYVRGHSSVSAIEGLGDTVLMSVLTDVTSQLQAEEELRTQKERLSAVINASPGGIAVFEMDPRDIPGTLHTSYYNDHFFSFSGYTREEYQAALDGNEMQLIFPEDRRLLAEAIVKLCGGEVGGGTAECTVRCTTKSGGFRWLLLTGQLVAKSETHCSVNIVLVDITAAREAQEKQRISEELFRIAAESDSRAMVLYDVRSNSCRVESRQLFSAKLGDVFEDIPGSLLDAGIAAPESMDALKGLFHRIRAGEKQISVSLNLHTSENEYQWFECNATTLFDDNGKPSQAVLALHNITEQRVKEAVYKKWQQSIETRPPESYTLFRSNLSRDGGIEEQNGSLIKIRFDTEHSSFNKRTAEYTEKCVYPDDRPAYSGLLDSDSLLARFYRGEHTASLEYREMGADGRAVWRLLTVEMVEYPNSTDIQAFLMFEDIDDRKKTELREKELAETDPLTGALNRVAFRDKVQETIALDGGAQHALIMIDLDGFKLLNDTFGHAAGDQALIEVAAQLRSLIRDDDLLCRLGGDEFLILLRDIAYDAAIEKKTRQMCELVRKTYSLDVQMSASIGVAVYPRDGRSMEALYRKADSALYSVKEAGKNSYSFYSRGDAQPESASAEQPRTAKLSGEPPKIRRRMLVVDDNAVSRMMLSNIFEDEYNIETAKSGAEAMIRLRHFGSSISIVLLDLSMPGMDGFEVLKRMQNNVEMRTIPVIVVSADDDYDTNLKAIGGGAADYVTKPVDPRLVKLRVRSAVSKSENERLRAQNSYLQLQRDEELKYHTVLESTGTVVIEYNWRNHVFIYGKTISKHIAGDYDNRGLWQIFLSDMVAESADVKTLQEAMMTLANDREQSMYSKLIRLKTPNRSRHWFRMNVYKQCDDFGLAEKMIITFNDVHEEVLTNEKLRNQATRDDVTGLYNRSGFFEKAEELIAQHEAGYYVMSCLDIEKFKVINDQYGSLTGDKVLRRFAAALTTMQSSGAICCRVMADIFAVLRPANMDDGLIRQARLHAETADGTLPGIRYCAGLCAVDDKSLSASAIYDRAAMAKDTVKGRYDVNVAVYDESMRTSMLRQQKLTQEMKAALEGGQFEVWFQPQFNHSTGMLSGAEALVRWRHPEEGIISPSEFIPMFERSGFVYEVDKYVWEQTCICLRRWLDMGLRPVPVAVNVSRYDVFRSDVIDVITGLVSKYGLAPSDLRLEITESAFSESADQIISVVKILVELGYTVEIDDFGSGYSSLNTLKDVPAQVIKMDMRFLENDANSRRGGSIVESVVRMARWLDMTVIAEGVETVEQADYLNSIGCEYVQGFLYSRPTVLADYEELFANDRVDPSLGRLRALNAWNNNAFWDPASMESLIFNSYVGAACIFEYHKGNIELLRANDKYIRELGASGAVSFAELEPSEYLDADNLKRMLDNIERAIATGEESAVELFWLRRDGGRTHLRSTVRVIARTGDRVLLYCMIFNQTVKEPENVC